MAEEQSAQTPIDESANLAENVDPILEEPDYIATDAGEKDGQGDHVELELSKPTDVAEDLKYRSPAEEHQPAEDIPTTELEPMDTSVLEDPLQPVENVDGEKSCETDDVIYYFSRSVYCTVDGRRFSNTNAPSTAAGSQILMHHKNSIRH